VTQLISLRQEARSMGAYDVADAIRDRLTAIGVELTDSAGGTTEFRLPAVGGQRL